MGQESENYQIICIWAPVDKIYKILLKKTKKAFSGQFFIILSIIYYACNVHIIYLYKHRLISSP